MKRHIWLIVTATCLLATTILLHAVHYLLFHDLHHLAIYGFGDLAFLPLEVLIVAFVIERVLHHHEKQQLMQKMNMVIGTFFSEFGSDLLTVLTPGLSNAEDIEQSMCVEQGWKASDFKRASKTVLRARFSIDPSKLDFEEIRDLLSPKRAILLQLLANPNLLEHDRFTDLLWSVSHLLEELQARVSLAYLPESDLRHLAGDVRRVYAQLAVQWLDYCRHLKSSYPYIFSIVTRTHPLQPNPDPIVHS